MKAPQIVLLAVFMLFGRVAFAQKKAWTFTPTNLFYEHAGFETAMIDAAGGAVVQLSYHDPEHNFLGFRVYRLSASGAVRYFADLLDVDPGQIYRITPSSIYFIDGAGTITRIFAVGKTGTVSVILPPAKSSPVMLSEGESRFVDTKGYFSQRFTDEGDFEALERWKLP